MLGCGVPLSELLVWGWRPFVCNCLRFFCTCLGLKAFINWLPETWPVNPFLDLFPFSYRFQSCTSNPSYVHYIRWAKGCPFTVSCCDANFCWHWFIICLILGCCGIRLFFLYFMVSLRSIKLLTYTILQILVTILVFGII